MAFGLFEKKFCSICGEKAKLLSRQKIKNKEYLCGKCLEKCSPDLTGDEYKQMTPEDCKENMAHMEKCDKIWKDQFETTDSVSTGFLSGNIFKADLEHGWWIHEGSHEIFRLDQVRSWHFDMDTSSLSEEEKEEQEEEGGLLGGILDTVFSPGFSRSDLYPCPPGSKINKMYVVINVDTPWVRTVRIVTMDPYSSGKNDVENGYEASAEIMDFLKEHSGVESDPIE